MKLEQALFLVFAVVSVACSSSTSSVPTATHPIIQVEFPAWVEESPKMAQHIATSDVIAKTKFVSLDSTTKRHGSYGYVAELVYTFEVVQYLKGDGADELVVRMSSGPKYIAFPDWLDTRTESEALELAQSWLGRSINIVGNKRDAILLVGRSGEGEDYYFTSSEDGQGSGGYPTVGETWLAEEKSSMYRHQFTDRKSATISLPTSMPASRTCAPLWKGITPPA